MADQLNLDNALIEQVNWILVLDSTHKQALATLSRVKEYIDLPTRYLDNITLHDIWPNDPQRAARSWQILREQLGIIAMSEEATLNSFVEGTAQAFVRVLCRKCQEFCDQMRAQFGMLDHPDQWENRPRNHPIPNLAVELMIKIPLELNLVLNSISQASRCDLGQLLREVFSRNPRAYELAHGQPPLWNIGQLNILLFLPEP